MFRLRGVKTTMTCVFAFKVIVVFFGYRSIGYISPNASYVSRVFG